MYLPCETNHDTIRRLHILPKQFYASLMMVSASILDDPKKLLWLGREVSEGGEGAYNILDSPAPSPRVLF